MGQECCRLGVGEGGQTEGVLGRGGGEVCGVRECWEGSGVVLSCVRVFDLSWRIVDGWRKCDAEMCVDV